MSVTETLRATIEAVPEGAGALISIDWLRELLRSEGSRPATSDDLTLKQLADRFWVAESTARTWCNQGLIPGAYKFNGRKWMIPPEAVESFVERQRAQRQ